MKFVQVFGRHITVVAALAAMFILATGATGEAAKKKAAEAAPGPATSVCFLVYHPVCASKGQTRQTYNNSCYARLDGAKISASGACPTPRKKGKG